MILLYLPKVSYGFNVHYFAYGSFLVGVFYHTSVLVSGLCDIKILKIPCAGRKRQILPGRCIIMLIFFMVFATFCCFSFLLAKSGIDFGAFWNYH